VTWEEVQAAIGNGFVDVTTSAHEGVIMARGQITMENSRENSRPNPIPGNKPFVKGDSRIRAGPGRPPLWWKHLLASYEADAVHTLGQALRSAKRWADRIRAAEIIMDRLHGKPTQPVKELPAVDVTGLTDDELSTLNSLLSRVLGPGVAGDPARGR
jgi:hypothetical protein